MAPSLNANHPVTESKYSKFSKALYLDHILARLLRDLMRGAGSDDSSLGFILFGDIYRIFGLVSR